MSKFLTVSFSGAGHLLSYHLGVSSLLYNMSLSPKTNKTKSKILPQIKAIAGSSSGSIAATILSRMPHRLEEFTDEFISKRGEAISILKSILHDEEKILSGISSTQHSNGSINISSKANQQRPNLYIATTNCMDGSLHLKEFSNHVEFATISSSWDNDLLMKTILASCTIPPSFHPLDLLPYRSYDLSYPSEEGVIIDDKAYVDGGIAAPIPPTPRNMDKRAYPVIVSPISYHSDGIEDTNSSNTNSKRTLRISPHDNSWRLLPLKNIHVGGCEEYRLQVKPSIQNLRALRISTGACSTFELRDWFNRGFSDADRLLSDTFSI